MELIAWCNCILHQISLQGYRHMVLAQILAMNCIFYLVVSFVRWRVQLKPNHASGFFLLIKEEI